MPMQDLMDEMGEVMREVVSNGHRVLITGDGGTHVTGRGWSWAWLTDDRQPDGRFHSVGPSAERLKAMSHAELDQWAASAVDAMHLQLPSFGCPVCGRGRP